MKESLEIWVVHVVKIPYIQQITSALVTAQVVYHPNLGGG